MRISSIGALGLLAITGAAVATIVFVASMKPTSAGAFAAFSAWLLAPHATMAAALLLMERKGGSPVDWPVVAMVVVCAGGLLFLADLIYWHTDAQGAIAVLMAPFFQGVALVVLLPIASALNRKRNRPP